MIRDAAALDVPAEDASQQKAGWRPRRRACGAVAGTRWRLWPPCTENNGDRMPYSLRSALLGSVREAIRAGHVLAAIATMTIKTTAAVNDARSSADVR
jgi:hypothetical protein